MIAVLGLFASLAVGCFLEFSTRCPCHRDGGPWFGPRHPRAAMMLFMALLVSVGTVGAVLDDSVVVLIWLALVSLFNWGRWWKHESGKWKRRAAKAAGRVAINTHGRLVVES